MLKLMENPVVRYETYPLVMWAIWIALLKTLGVDITVFVM